MLGHRDGRVVGGRDAHTLEERAQRRRLSLAQSHAIARRLRGVAAHLDRLIPFRFARLQILEGEVEGHELHQAGRGMVLARILGEKHLAVGVEEEHRLGVEGKPLAVLGRRRQYGGGEHEPERDGEADCRAHCRKSYRGATGAGNGKA
jgi:hypothetical protein